MTSTTLTVIQSSPDVPLGTFAAHLAAAGLQTRTVRADLGEPVPDVADLGAGLLVLGGTMSVHDDASAPWLPDLRALLLAAATTGVPTLAVCLGAQLLAVAGGGQVTVAAPPGQEAGATRIFWRPEAREDAVVGELARAVAQAGERASVFVSKHDDAVSELPAGAVWLASSNTYPFQAFRLGSALGVQFHPEADAGLLAGWLGSHPAPEREAILAELGEHAARAASDGAALAAGFVAQVRAGAVSDVLV